MHTVPTKDGSTTFHSKEYDETYHSTSGALEEAQKKFIEPCKITDGMTILDIGFGLGYNILMALQSAKHLTIVSLEKDTALLKKLKNVKVPEELQENYKKILLTSQHEGYEDAETDIQLIMGSAEKTVKTIDKEFDAVFLDPFSPKKNPELWTTSFFNDIFKRMKKGGILATYSCAGQVRRNLKEAGFLVKDGPKVGRRSPSTIAIK